MTATIEVLSHQGDLLGEGPLWLEAENAFGWVDIGQALWHRLDLSSGKLRTVAFDSALTAFAPAAGGGYIGAFADGLARFDAAGTRAPLLHAPEAELADNRFNDGGTDPAGRFLAGSMNMAGTGATGSLYALDSDAALRHLKGGIGIANTIAFSPDGTVFYTADSSDGRLMAFDYDPGTGTLGPQRSEFRPPEDLPGGPDGSAVDAEGFLWNARWDGGCILRLAPDGRLDRIIELPVSRPTSCAFVGQDLVVTTSTWDYTDAQREAEPLAGALLRVPVGIEGLPRPIFAG